MTEKVPASLAEIEALFADSIIKIGDINGMMQTVVATQATLATAHAEIGKAVTMLAKTFEKVEERQSQLEKTNTELYTARGVPPTVFFIVVSTLSALLILGGIWVTDTFIKASFSSFEAGKKQITTGVQDGN